MIKPLSISLLLASVALAGCVETTATKTVETPVVTGGDLSGVPARACCPGARATSADPVPSQEPR